MTSPTTRDPAKLDRAVRVLEEIRRELIEHVRHLQAAPAASKALGLATAEERLQAIDVLCDLVRDVDQGNP